jgi:hypothetical protein
VLHRVQERPREVAQDVPQLESVLAISFGRNVFQH